MDNEKREIENTEFTNPEIIETPDIDVVEDVISEDVMEVSEIDESLTEEELEELIAEKKKKTRKVLGITGIAVAIAFILGLIYSLCIINGVGSKTVVNTSLPAKYSDAGEKLEEEKFDIKFENPFVSLFGGKNANILTVNGYGIDKELFNYFLKSTALNYEYDLYLKKTITDLKSFDWNAINEETSLKNSEIVKGEAVKFVAPILAVISEAEKRGVSLTEEEENQINDWSEQLRASYGDNLENALMQSGYDSVEQLIKIQKLQTLYQKAYDAFLEEPLSYVKRFDDYKKVLSKDKITVVHILLNYPEGVTRESSDEEKAESKKKAEEVLAKAKAGEDFATLIETYSSDPGQGKYGYTFANDGTMMQSFADASFDLEIGEISNLVETDYGYHIIKRTERIPDFNEYLELVGDNLKARINRFLYSNIIVDADLSEYMGEEEAVLPENSAE